MPHNDPAQNQILTTGAMRAAEQALVDAGVSVDELMQRAGGGAAQWVWRIAAHRPVTVLCGPGNNGGDGYVIAEAIRRRGGHVTVVSAHAPASDACKTARSLFTGPVVEAQGGGQLRGDVLVDCLFGSGLSRPLAPDDLALLQGLAARHAHRVAVDLPSGVQSDTGMALNADLPDYELTLALGAFKFAHVLMPACARMGTLRLVPIGVAPTPGAARRIVQPRIEAPAADSHKYTRGMLAVVGGAMPGAAILASLAAQGAGAGYVKLFADSKRNCPPDLVVDTADLSDALIDHRNAAVMIGPGLGRDARARERLALALADEAPVLLDADALVLLSARLLASRTAPGVATPHEGELVALERAFDLDGSGSKPHRALELARASAMVVVAKGPDTVIAAPDGRLACFSGASPWLSTAGTGDVLAGTIASRMAAGIEGFEAATQGVWLHADAARHCPPAFTAGQLAQAIPAALAACL